MLLIGCVKQLVSNMLKLGFIARYEINKLFCCNAYKSIWLLFLAIFGHYYTLFYLNTTVLLNLLSVMINLIYE